MPLNLFAVANLDLVYRGRRAANIASEVIHAYLAGVAAV
jgi:hypothetical protein